MLDEIFDIVAKKHKLPEDQIRLIYKSFTDGIRFYISNPLFSKATIRIPGLGAFKMTNRSVANYRKRDMVEQLQDYKEQFKRKKNVSKQRQSSTEIYDAGSDEI